MAPLRITLLGSTGSIGKQTLDVVSKNPERFEVIALSGHSNVELLVEQAQRFRPRFIAVTEPAAARLAQITLGSKCEVLCGEQALTELVSLHETQVVVAAVVGFAGLSSVVSALRHKKCVALANKESLVAGGPIIRSLLDQGGCSLVPIDSEHNSIYQLLQGRELAEISRILLTASGGPFLNTPVTELAAVTPQQAIAHPRWRMGAKISVDSATLMNKGLELIEARWLFDVDVSRLGVLIHPQSIVHGLVELSNCTLLAALSRNDMRLPISVALDAAGINLGLRHAETALAHGVPLLDLAVEERLEFYSPDCERFPALELCTEALRLGGGYPAVLNAANEVAVEAFLAGGCKFTAIVEIVAETLGGYPGNGINALGDVISADYWGRDRAAEVLGKFNS